MRLFSFIRSAASALRKLEGRLHRWACLSRLIQSDVGVQAARRLTDALRADIRERRLTRAEDIVDHLKGQLKSMWPEADRAIRFAASGPTVIFVAGVNGAGKTTSVAKIAKSMVDSDKTVLLAACDTFRAGAVRQARLL